MNTADSFMKKFHRKEIFQVPANIVLSPAADIVPYEDDYDHSYGKMISITTDLLVSTLSPSGPREATQRDLLRLTESTEDVGANDITDAPMIDFYPR